MIDPDDAGKRYYIRFAALGDSATCGLGDPVDDGWRGWARILADAMAQSHDVSFCNLAVTGATAADVRHRQLRDALNHRPQVASLIVGLNDTMRSTWAPATVHDDLMASARELAATGALLLTVRFHDHSRVFRLPKVLARPMGQRIEAVNAAYDAIHQEFGGLRIDLAQAPEVLRPEFWSMDRLHPSELGHRFVACQFAHLLGEAGLSFPAPDASTPGTPLRRRREIRRLIAEGGPWMGRRARDLGPWAARLALAEVRSRLAGPLLPPRDKAVGTSG